MVKLNAVNISWSELWVSRHDQLSDFYACVWQRGASPVPLLAARALLAAGALAILAFSVLELASPLWYIYLTNWGVLLVAATTLSGLFLSIKVLNKKPFADDDGTKLPWYVSVYWLLFNSGVTISIMITVLYWTLVYDAAVQAEREARQLWLDVTTHGVTALLLVAELLLARTPVRLAHVYQPLGLALWYSAFSAIYYAAGGTDVNGNQYIYEVLDWEHGARSGGVVAAAAAALLLLYVLLWATALLRDRARRALYPPPPAPHAHAQQRA